MSWFSKLFREEKQPAVNAEAFVSKAKEYIAAAQAQADAVSSQKKKPVAEVSNVQFSVRDNYSRDSIRSTVKSAARNDMTDWGLLSRDLGAYLNVGFVEEMEDIIQSKGLKDSSVYKAARIDRRLFSKIMSDRSYKPAKDTCIAIALALELPLSKAEELLSRAGYTLSHSSKRDVILEFCISEKLYNIGIVNDLLYRLGEKTLGR